MGKNDVVKHDLTTGASLDWDADVLPMEMPRSSEPPPSGPPAPRVNAPNDTMITGQLLTEAPYRSIGKMLLRFSSGGKLGASGWVVAKRAFITAGHCVYYPSKGGWIIEAGFCPRYNLTCDKMWKVSAVYTLQGWIDGERPYDLAACVVTEDFGVTEPPVVFSTSILPALEYAAIGYPIDPTSKHDFNGKRMWQSYGDSIKYEDGLLYAENDLTRGASGGPWLRAAEGDEAGGITSARGDDPNVAKSPAFGEGFTNLYNAVKDL